MSRRNRPQNRGFALLFVVLIVAVVAVAAAALLDIVEVDLLIVGEQRRSTEAQAIAEGAVKEIQADETKGNLLPSAMSPGMTTRYTARNVAGEFVRDPDGLNLGPIVLDEATSAYIANNTAANAGQREGYTSTIQLLRTGPAINSGLNTVQAVVYEVSVQASVANGRSTSQVMAQTFVYTAAQQGVVGQMHAR